MRSTKYQVPSTKYQTRMHRLFGSWFLVLGSLILATGCGKHGKAAPVGGSDVPPSQVKLKRNVELARAEQKALEYFVETVGTLEAEGQTDIAAGVTGVVDEVLFREGQMVSCDTILVKVDQRRYISAAEVARANEKRAETNLVLAKELERISRSAGQGSSQEDKAKTLLNMKLAEAELLGARANRALAEHNLNRSQVKAPYNGQINQRKVTPGSYLEEKTVIGTMADLSRLRLVGWIPEKATPTVRDQLLQQERSRAARILAAGLASGRFPTVVLTTLVLDAAGLPATDFGLEFTLLPYPKRTFRGRIFYLSTVANADTHMFECKAEVNMQSFDVELKPGFTARIRCPLRGNPNAVIVPEESVRASERGFIAFVPVKQVARDGQDEWVARARVLELGFRSPGYVEVLQGVAPGEWLVRRGAEALEDGTPIHIPEAQVELLAAYKR